VTLNDPITTNLYHTVVHLACSKAGATDANTAVANTWSLFSSGGTGPANVKNWDGSRTLYYYQPGIGFSGCTATDVGDLLSAGNGQCTSWARLMKAALGANGINSLIEQVIANNQLPFLVKNWTFTNAPSFQLPFAWKLTLPNSFDMVPEPAGGVYGDLTSLNTLAGQNSQPPAEKFFSQHFIVKYTDPGAGLISFYDPSYGVTYTGQDNFEDNAVDAYATSPSPDLTQWHVEQSQGLHNIIFNDTPF
jgi:hypothetical protein